MAVAVAPLASAKAAMVSVPAFVSVAVAELPVSPVAETVLIDHVGRAHGARQRRARRMMPWPSPEREHRGFRWMCC